VIQVISFPGPLANAGENGNSAMLLGDIVDHFHKNNGLAHPCSAEHPHFATLGKGDQKINNLYPGFQDFNLGALVNK
jgi:hypothetical protein